MNKLIRRLLRGMGRWPAALTPTTLFGMAEVSPAYEADPAGFSYEATGLRYVRFTANDGQKWFGLASCSLMTGEYVGSITVRGSRLERMKLHPVTSIPYPHAF